jgi:glycerol kinase
VREGAPTPDPTAELQQVGAVVESIAFLIAVNVLAMHGAAPLQRLVITGGLALCDYLCEVLAEVTGMIVERPALLEATSRGIAYLAAGQPQDWQAIPIEQSFAPTGRHAVRGRFNLWRAAMSARGARSD